ncbi:MAG: hypothetical protein PHY75_01975 [Bacteroidales bacterium]|jgi:hypothetical protein|nr:hypothetical protein [Bacteroidales bacterium]
MKQLLIILLLFTLSIHLNAQDKNNVLKIEKISERQFKSAFNKNYNAIFITTIHDSLKIESAYDEIAKTYNDEEKELAERELIKTRELTDFIGYYPTLKTYLFFIQDYHYEKACFVSSISNKVLSHNRFRGSYGVMSKDGFWIGLERWDCDNYFQMEICKVTSEYVSSIIKFDYQYFDIYEDLNNNMPLMFWAKKNTIYISTIRHDTKDISSKPILGYYSIEFEYDD